MENICKDCQDITRCGLWFGPRVAVNNAEAKKWSSCIGCEFAVEVKNKLSLLLHGRWGKGPWKIAEAAKTILIEAAKDHIPKRKKKRTPWISQQTLDKIEERRRLKGKRDEVCQRRYKELSTDIKVACRQDKKNYIKDKCRKIESHHARNNSQEMFRETNSGIYHKEVPPANESY